MTLLVVLLVVLASAATSRTGVISHNDDQTGRYLALPCKTGNVRCDLTVKLCGPAACEVMRQTDYGPSQRIHPDRIADVSPSMFERLCGKPASAGLCRGSWTVVDGAAPTLPPTDTARPNKADMRGYPARTNVTKP